MKAGYKKPIMEIEKYELNASIASNCKSVISFGPGNVDGTEKVCDEFGDSWGEPMTLADDVSFYESGSTVCTCYYSSGGQGYFTS